MPWKQLELTEDDRYALRTLEKKTRFLVDENVHAEVVRFLRADGWNVKSVDDVGLRGHSDEDVLAFAHREDRVTGGFGPSDRVLDGLSGSACLVDNLFALSLHQSFPRHAV